MKFLTIIFALWALSASPAQAEEQGSGFGGSYFSGNEHPGFTDPADIMGGADAAAAIEPAAGDDAESKDTMMQAPSDQGADKIEHVPPAKPADSETGAPIE